MEPEQLKAESEVINVVVDDYYFKSGDELLISLVKSYPNLWDKNNKEYKDIRKKNISWTEISSTLSESVETCQKRWGRLREYYAKERAKKERQMKSGNPAPKRQWVLYDEMDFLNEHMHRRNAFSSFKRKPSPHSGNEDNIYSEENESFHFNESSSSAFIPNEVNFKCSIPSKKARPVSTSPTQESAPKAADTSKEKNQCDQNIPDEVLQAFNEIKTTIGSIAKDISKTEGDPRDHALSNLILRELQATPEAKKSKLRKKLYSVVIDFLEDNSDN